MCWPSTSRKKSKAALTSAISRFLRKTKRVTPPDISTNRKQTPLLLVPRGALGDRVVSAFADEWLKLGGASVLQQRFGSTAELRAGVNGGGGIALSGTPVSTLPSAQNSILGSADEMPVSSGGSVDAAYILATPEQIAYIKPMIAMRNGSQSNVTLYASSRSAQAPRGRISVWRWKACSIVRSQCWPAAIRR